MAVAAVAGVAAVPLPTGVIGDVEHLVCSTNGTEFGHFCSTTAILACHGPVSHSITGFVKWTWSAIHVIMLIGIYPDYRLHILSIG